MVATAALERRCCSCGESPPAALLARPPAREGRNLLISQRSIGFFPSGTCLYPGTYCGTYGDSIGPIFLPP